jgi:hypothetical protein
MASQPSWQGSGLSHYERELIVEQLGRLVDQTRSLEARLLALLDEVTHPHDGEAAQGRQGAGRSATDASQSR